VLSDRIKIEFESDRTEDASITVIDLSGRPVYTTQVRVVRGKQNLEIGVSNLIRGMYFVQYKPATGLTQTAKVIKN
jgi:hypothetical protein